MICVAGDPVGVCADRTRGGEAPKRYPTCATSGITAHTFFPLEVLMLTVAQKK